MSTTTTPAPSAPASTPIRTPEGLLAWRKAHKLSQRALGELLEVQWITVLRWERGQVAIPRTVELALLYLDTTLEVPS